MNKDKKNKLIHTLLMIFSPAYKENYERENGERIWAEITGDLPEPTGIPGKDSKRINLFSKRVKALPLEEQNLLRNWIHMRLAFYEDSPDEDASPTILEYERKWKRIYHMHLSVM